MSKQINDINFNGVMIEEHPDPRNYNISMFVPGKDIIPDEEFCLKLPNLEIIIDQTFYSACVGHAFATAKAIIEYNRTNKWMDIDPFMIYGTRYAGEYTGLGMYPYQGAQVLYKDGAFLRRDFNIQQEVPHLINTVKEWKEKHPDEVEKAKDLQISGYYYAYNDTEIKKSLKNGMPVSVAYPIYNSFYRTSADGKVPIPSSNEKIQGYHQMLIVGWTKDNYWIVINSWGTAYGLRGMYLIPFANKWDSAIVVSDTITPAKYKAKEIVFNVGYNDFFVDGQVKMFDATPYIKNDRTYVPVRFITEALGASVEWLNDTREVIIRSEEAIIKLKIGSNQVVINGDIEYIDTVPEILNDRTMLPIRVIAEALNCNVDYYSGKVIISAL